MPDEEILEEVSAGQPDEEPAPEVSEEAPAPVEVVSVDELLARLSELMATETDPVELEPEEPAEEEPEPVEPEPSLADRFFAASLDDDSTQQIAQLLTEVRDTLQDERPALSTPFAEYTVAEGLLLALLLCVVGNVIVRMLKGGFSWLLW